MIPNFLDGRLNYIKTFRTLFCMVFKWCDLMIRRTIQIPDILDHKTESLSCFQTIIRNLYHSTTGHVWNIWIPDLSVIQMVTVVSYSDPHFLIFRFLMKCNVFCSTSGKLRRWVVPSKSRTSCSTCPPWPWSTSRSTSSLLFRK